MASGKGSGAGCGSGLMKCLLIILNVVFGLLGLIILAVGVFFFVGLEKVANDVIGTDLEAINTLINVLYLQDADQIPDGKQIDFIKIVTDLAIPFIVIGSVLLFCAFLGCCGACCESKVLLFIYVVICSILLLIQIVLVVLFFVGILMPEIKKYLQKTVDTNYGGIDDYTPWSLTMNFIMIKFECCGINGYEDFNSTTKWNRTKKFIINGQAQTVTLITPLACCKFDGSFPKLGAPKDKECASSTKPLNNETNNYEKGCWDEINKEVDVYYWEILGGIIALLVVQLIIILAAIIIMRSSRDEK